MQKKKKKKNEKKIRGSKPTKELLSSRTTKYQSSFDFHFRQAAT